MAQKEWWKIYKNFGNILLAQNHGFKVASFKEGSIMKQLEVWGELGMKKMFSISRKNFDLTKGFRVWKWRSQIKGGLSRV